MLKVLCNCYAAHVAMGLQSLVLEKNMKVFIQCVVEAAFGVDFQLPGELKIVIELHCLFIWVGKPFSFSMLAPTETNCCLHVWNH